MNGTGTHDFKAYQGTTINYTLTWGVAGVPVDLAGYSARLQLRHHIDSGEPALELTSTDGITLGSDGKIIFTIDAPTTAALPAWPYVYGLELTSPGGDVSVPLEGRFTIRQRVTR